MRNRLLKFWHQPLSRKLQYLSFLWARIMMVLAYRWRMVGCGKNSVVLRPLFWTPEFISLGNDVLVWTGCRLEGLENKWGRPRIHIDNGVTIQQNCHITAATMLHIQAGSTILANVVITDIDHLYDDFGTSVIKQPIKVQPTSIGRNCFIGAGARILAGTILGEGCVVGANAVVRGTYPAGSVIVGIPGRVIRKYDLDTKCWSSTKSDEG